MFKNSTPAQLRQGDWMSDSAFLDTLYQSWRAQYADYIGEKKAALYVQNLHREGRLYDHHDPLTLHAWVDERIVGVTALRSLDAINLITMLEIHPDFQRNGIGGQLLEALCCASDKLMAHVSIHRPDVLLFYKRHGFHVLNRANVQHGEHVLAFDVVARST